MTLKTVCWTCSREMKVNQIGVAVLELDAEGRRYKLWRADILKCPKCGHEVVCRFADRPISQQGVDGFAKDVAESIVVCKF